MSENKNPKSKEKNYTKTKQHQRNKRTNKKKKNKGRKSKPSIHYQNDRCIVSCSNSISYLFIQLIYGVIALALRELKITSTAAAETINKLFHFFVLYISF